MKKEEPERMTWEYMQDLHRHAREWAIIRQAAKQNPYLEEQDSD